MKPAGLALWTGLTVALSVGLSALVPPHPRAGPTEGAILPPQVSRAEKPVPPSRADGPLLSPRPGGDGPSALERLEAKVEALQRQVTALVDEREALLRGGGAAGPTVDSDAGARSATADQEAALDAAARSLGLDRRRADALFEALTSPLARLAELEAANATVEDINGVLTIRIAAFPQAAAEIRGQWERWVESNLSREELERYRSEHVEGRVFGARLTGRPRRIEIRPDADTGGLLYRQFVTGESGTETEVLRTLAPTEARELLLAPLRHLLPRK